MARAALALAASLILVGTALAHSVVYETNLSLGRSPSGTVGHGTTVTFSGRLSSASAKCQRRSRIKLVRVGVGVVARTRTDGSGDYSFQRKVSQTATWRTRFKGKVLNPVHPHNHVCGASASSKVRVPVG